MMRNQQIYRHHMIYIKDQNLKSLHEDLRRSNVTRYELAPKRYVNIKVSGRLVHRNFTKIIAYNFKVLGCRTEIMESSVKIKTSPKSRTNLNTPSGIGWPVDQFSQ